MNINDESNPKEEKYSSEDSNKDIQKEIFNNDMGQSITKDEDYKFGWNKYSEITNGRFAMIGFLAILLIELLSNKSFMQWAGIFN